MAFDLDVYTVAWAGSAVKIFNPLVARLALVTLMVVILCVVNVLSSCMNTIEVVQCVDLSG